MKRFFYIIVSLALAVILFSSLLIIYDLREKISNRLDMRGVSELNDRLWAERIMSGGYILHFRHAERQKWIDVQMYDALESDVHNNGDNGSRFAENDYFSEAVCLNSRGEVQARAMGEHLQNIGLPIGNVISSVSCRARQTADLAFGGYDTMLRILVHKGPYNEDYASTVEQLTELYQSLEVEDGTNTVVSSHNSVVDCDMFVNKEDCPRNLYLEEGGFYVIRASEAGLIFEYEFNNFNNFIKTFYER